ncbi:helix-turn-helix domain-containing protein [Kitasatospora sp. NPDC094011]|uniref:helix-turn-helix domain-containing protein n=1 Tax=Kitasatospora sp. NPDC094011 TaxID=3364090 RepID=UPI00380FA569
MGYKGPISQRQRRFGEELQRLRTAAGLSAPEAGALVGMKGPAVSHTEAGRITLNPDRLETWLDAYGCTDSAYRRGLAEMGQSNGKGWWSEYEGRVPDLSLDLAELETRATRFDNFETLYIPGLLQSPAYAEAIYKDAYRNGRWDLATAIQFRMDRQQILDSDRQFRFVVHEAALRMQFPGLEAMRAQLAHILSVAERPNVTIQILPFTATKKPPSAGPFVVCNPGCTDLSTIVLDLPGRAEHDGTAESIAAYGWKFQQLSEIALPAVDATSLSSSRNSWGLLQYLLYPLQA